MRNREAALQRVYDTLEAQKAETAGRDEALARGEDAIESSGGRPRSEAAAFAPRRSGLKTPLGR